MRFFSVMGGCGGSCSVLGRFAGLYSMKGYVGSCSVVREYGCPAVWGEGFLNPSLCFLLLWSSSVQDVLQRQTEWWECV